jgi:hypothetical protein
VTPTEASVLTNQSTLEITGYTDTEVQFVKILYVDARGEPQTGLVLVVPVGQPAKFWFEYQLPLNTDGNEHVVQVLGIDQAENFGEASFTYTAKVNKPFLEILGFKQRVTETFVWINGTTEPGIDTVTINGQQFPVEDQGFNVRWNLPIAEGNYSFTVSVRDAAGNVETWNDRTEVHAAAPPPPPPVQQAFWERFDFQLAAGVGLLAVAAMALLMAFSRRREVD